MEAVFDSLGYVKKMEATGVPRKQAEAQAETFRDLTRQLNEAVKNEAATKGDLRETELALQKEIQETKLALQKEIRETELRLQKEIALVREVVSRFLRTFVLKQLRSLCCNGTSAGAVLECGTVRSMPQSQGL